MHDLHISGHSHNLSFMEQRFADYVRDPNSIPPDWRKLFEQFDGEVPSDLEAPSKPPFPQRSLFHPLPTDGRPISGAEHDVALRQEWLDQLIRSHRSRGHVLARVDPLGTEHNEPPELDPAFFGFTEEDWERTFSTSWMGGPEVRTLRQIVTWLRNTYCRNIGVQFMHIDSLVVRSWLQKRMEANENRTILSREEQLRILSRLTDAVIFEDFLQKKYVGAKSFSLEGAESLIPLLDLAIEKAADDGIDEIVLGMAHRGRLNVLANVMGKNPRNIFREFDDVDPERHLGGGDVKYHMGFSSDWETAAGNRLHLTLCFNPSHLEFVNPVALGRMRAKQDRAGDRDGDNSFVILIHGDAAFAGEGVVQETLNLSELPGYSTGGTIHVIVNNQIGFTTSPVEGRSCAYATDIARMLQIPIFHVNGEDPEAVAQVVQLAIDFRNRFHRDVVIDMYCYRRRGHNEGDEPSFTQPQMVKLIQSRPDVRDSYLDHLLKLGGITREDAAHIVEQRLHHLEEELAQARRDDYQHQDEMFGGVWAGYRGGPDPDQANTGKERTQLQQCLIAASTVPAGFHSHPKLKRLLQQRQDMATGSRPLDWGAAEMLAFASLAVDGFRLRLSGQDCGRGTFSHRHAVLHDYEDGSKFVPLQHLSDGQAPVEIYNSPLSEAGVLGFDYGYSLDTPDGLVVWEAQFGDFCNTAQVIIDQFICTAEDKWKRLSGLVMFLPHGLEGQGPEHSSARLERFLALAAEDNIQVIYPTTPAQLFHALRRQMVRRWRKPLVVMTPKSLLRHPRAISSLSECADGQFQNVIASPLQNSNISRVLLCTGKLFYEVEDRCRLASRDDIDIIRVEQLYPFPHDELAAALARYAEQTPAIWVQEEPENMGAWLFFRDQYEKHPHRLPLAGVFRPASASPATGSRSSHELEQAALLDAAMSDEYLSKHPPSRRSTYEPPETHALAPS